MSRMKHYLHLIRWYQPTGTLLLLWPPLWCLFMLSPGWPPLDILLCFILGAFCMRSAGCIINDLTDRKLDQSVERTKNRPLASGAVPLSHAFILLALLLFVALGIAFYLGWAVVITSIFALPLVVAYPWMKRITYWPQLFLGITFNYGVLIASVALTGELQLAAWWLYFAAMFWTLGFDTIYGFQDISDDEKIGIKSTSRLIKNQALPVLTSIYLVAFIFFLKAGDEAGYGMEWLWAAIPLFSHFFWQISKLDIYSPALCHQLFKASGFQLGPLVLGGILLAKLV